MVLYKYGESIGFSTEGFRSSDSIKQDTELHDRFVKIAAQFRKIAPKAEDFLYFTAIMMHAAERALYDEDGNLLKTADGKPVEAHWDVNEKTGSWKWICNDPKIKSYKNQNGDIFPEIQLKVAYKHWIGKPLCKDHQSSSVDGVRGFIVDTYWDDKHKRIIALCALDKISYPDLARKVSTGYLNCVSMGVGVGTAICYDCGAAAHTENEYCIHMRNKTAYGEINVGLQPIELSLVVNGADRKALILEVLANTKKFEENLKKTGTVDINKIKEIKEEFVKLSNRIDEIENDILSSNDDNNLTLKRVATLSNQNYNEDIDLIKTKMLSIEDMIRTIAKNLQLEDLMTNTKQAYWQGTEEPTPGKPKYPKEEADKIRNTEAKPPTTDLGSTDGIPKQDMEKKKMLARATIDERRALRAAAVERAQVAIKQAYPQGTTEQTKYPIDPGSKVRETEFKVNDSIGSDGVLGGKEELNLKKELARASLKARLVKADSAGDNKWEIVDTADNKILLSATFDEITGGKKALYGSIASDNFAREMMRAVRTAGVEKANEIYKSAQGEPVPPPAGDPGMAAETPADTAPELPKEGEDKTGPVSVDSGALKEVSDTLSDVSSKLSEMVGGTDALKEEAGGMPGAGDVMSNPEAATEQALADLTGGAPQAATASLNTLRIVLNAGLKKAFKKNIKGLRAAKEELELLMTTANNNAISPEFLANISKEAVEDANKIMKKSRMLQAAFVKYAKGTLALEKRAAMETKMRKVAEKPTKDTYDPLKGKTHLPNAPVGVSTPATGSSEAQKAGQAAGQAAVVPGAQTSATSAGQQFGEQAKTPSAPPKKAEQEYDLTTLEGRKSYREKLAANIESKVKYSDMIGKAHPKSDTKLGGVAEGKEATVEGIDTIHDLMNKAVSEDAKEGKVKKAAEQLDKLIKAGKVNPEDLDLMVKEGLDKATADYWKKYWGQTDGGKEFADGMLKEYSKGKTEKKAQEDLDNYKAKYAKAYELAYSMSEAGLINKNNSAIKAEADKIVGYTDDAYTSMERVVAHHLSNIRKTASVQVGVAYDNEDGSAAQPEGSLYDELVSAFAGKRY